MAKKMEISKVVEEVEAPEFVAEVAEGDAEEEEEEEEEW